MQSTARMHGRGSTMHPREATRIRLLAALVMIYLTIHRVCVFLAL
jgi:hypothetical protein